MSGKIKIAVVGMGYWGPKLARNISTSGNAELKALVDINPEILKKYSELYPGVSLFDSYESALKNKDIEAVILSTPAGMHYAQIKKALEAGKHVFAEKPMVLSAAEAMECIKLAREKNLILMAGHTFIFNSAVRWVKEHLDAGEFGKLYYISAQRLSLGTIRDDVNVLWNLAPHDFSILLYLLDEMPITVRAQGARLLKTGNEDVVVVNFEYSDHRLATIELSWLNPQKVRQMTFVAEKGMIVYDDVSQDKKITVYDKSVNVTPIVGDKEGSFGKFQTQIRSGEMSVPDINFEEPLKLELGHFVDCINSGEEPICGGDHALKVTCLLELAQESLKNGGEKISVPVL